jgi:hypothetical protein
MNVRTRRRTNNMGRKPRCLQRGSVESRSSQHKPLQRAIGNFPIYTNTLLTTTAPILYFCRSTVSCTGKLSVRSKAIELRYGYADNRAGRHWTKRRWYHYIWTCQKDQEGDWCVHNVRRVFPRKLQRRAYTVVLRRSFIVYEAYTRHLFETIEVSPLFEPN